MVWNFWIQVSKLQKSWDNEKMPCQFCTFFSIKAFIPQSEKWNVFFFVLELFKGLHCKKKKRKRKQKIKMEKKVRAEDVSTIWLWLDTTTKRASANSTSSDNRRRPTCRSTGACWPGSGRMLSVCSAPPPERKKGITESYTKKGFRIQEDPWFCYLLHPDPKVTNLLVHFFKIISTNYLFSPLFQDWSIFE